MNTPKKLAQIFRPKERHWVGDGFYVSTVFSVHSHGNDLISPFILMDHARPRPFPPTKLKLGVGEHPHRGFETVTLAIQGSVDHRDSGGGGGTITSGGVQWMTAGSGVVHEEFHSRDFAENGGTFEMVQLWVNLPKEYKMVTPRYQSMNVDRFPVVSTKGNVATVKTIAGEYDGLKGPAKTYSPMNMYEIHVEKDGEVILPFSSGTNTLVVQLKGDSQVESENLVIGEVAVYEREGEDVHLKVTEGSHLLVLNGQPIDEPVATHGPFVMNTKTEILEAIRDYQEGKMGRLVKEG